MLTKIYWNNIKSKPITGLFFITGYFGLNFYMNYKCFQYLKNSEINVYKYYLMVL